MASEETALEILRRLEAAGHRAYLVGGCVRDRLLGRPVHDWDVATSARPEQVTALFARTIPTGLRHGTVTVAMEDGTYEVTTFRAETGYADGRHPDAVRFVADVAQDLGRRDFTVNAMAMDAAGEVVDRYGGRADLAAGLLRAVGDPARRFREDALRMLRAVRFSAQLGFRVEAETARAMAALAPLCARLSAERVRDELEKTLLSPAPRKAEEMVRLGMLRAFGLEPGTARPWPPAAAAERAARWTAFVLAFPQADLERLRLDRRTARLCRAAAAAWEPRLTAEGLARLTAREGWETARCVCAVNGQEALWEALRASGRCVTVAQLAVDGRDLGAAGPSVGRLLARLLDHVLDHPEDNDRTRLLALAAQWREER